MSASIKLETLGCRLNEAELENWARSFTDTGHRITPELNDADIIVINTCAVTQVAIKKSRQTIRKARRDNPAAKIVVSGCYGTLQPDLAETIPGIDLLIPNADKDKLVAIIRDRLNIDGELTASQGSVEPVLLRLGRQRAFIKIQDGCRHRCTYCIVTIARGDERSVPIKEIIEHVNALYREGISEVSLTGVHIGGYGKDIGESIHSLIRAILAETDIPRLRLASLEPWNLPGGFLELFGNKRLMPHLHLPLQSGSDKILRMMGRRCKTPDYQRLVRDLRGVSEDFNITTDIIAGFPGEMDADWKTGLEFIESMGFGHIHIFPYSPRPGTAAANFSGRVDPTTMKVRCAELHQLSQRLKKDFVTRQLGKDAPVLFEEEVTGECANSGFVTTGYTPNFTRVKLAANDRINLTNRVETIRMIAYEETSGLIVGELLDK
jgi:threonylcarbamoyladenosine tRNA methylthiotransferase MtaB